MYQNILDEEGYWVGNDVLVDQAEDNGLDGAPTVELDMTAALA